jgi:GH15 family glucan-1,4-alpha-glucosidase
MKSLKIIILFLFVLNIFYINSNAQISNLPSSWLFTTGDNIDYKNEYFNDASWHKIKVPTHWENDGFSNYDGYAWYRVYFFVDLKKLKDNEYYLFVGKIDDIDETYLNGQLIGSTGIFPPKPQSAWNEQRAYKIPKSLLKEKNILAIKVYDMGAPGGIHSGSLGIYDIDSFKKEMNLTPGPKKSFHQLVTSNGLIAAVYNEKENMIEGIYPHIFQAYDENKAVLPFIKNLKLETKEKPISVTYLKNTHVISALYKEFGVSYFTPFARKYFDASSNHKVFYAVIKGKDKKIKSLLFSYDSTYCNVLANSYFINGPNGTNYKIFLFSFKDSLHDNNKMFEASGSDALTNWNSLVNDEINFMRKFIEDCDRPKGLTKNEKNLFEQSISVLKMSQVSQSEIFQKAKGQILASLPPGIWNICWVRDACYSILALNKLGKFEEAQNALKFFLNADVGFYKNYIHSDGFDYGVGEDYKISVCRYYGIGKEESDYNQDGPNIELDGFGLFLFALSDYVTRSNDSIFLKDNYKLISSKVADIIVNSISVNNLIRKDSGPWERHLPGKQFAYTSITAANGLKEFAVINKKYGLEYKKYEQAYSRLLKGINEGLIVYGKLIKNNFEINDPKTFEFFDASTFEAFNFNLFNDKIFLSSHFNEYESYLRINKDRGFYRVNNGDYYDSQEWIFLNMRIASSLIKFNERNKAKKLIDWVTNQSKLNFNLVAELYEKNKSTYEGAVPMVGFGAGSYILTLFDFYSKK